MKTGPAGGPFRAWSHAIHHRREAAINRLTPNREGSTRHRRLDTEGRKRRLIDVRARQKVYAVLFSSHSQPTCLPDRVCVY